MLQIIRVQGGRVLWVLAWDPKSELRSKSGFLKHFLVVTLGPSHSFSEPQFAHLYLTDIPILGIVVPERFKD